jgi:hypothetical protein
MNTYPVNLELRNSEPGIGPVDGLTIGALIMTVFFSGVPFVLGANLIGFAMIVIPIIGITFLACNAFISPKQKALNQKMEKESQKLQDHMKANYQLGLSLPEAKDLFHGRDVTITRDDSTEVTINLSDKGVFVVKGETTKLSLNPGQETVPAAQEKILPTQLFTV